MQTYAYGFPRLGRNKEFKRHIESFWDKKISEKELVSSLGALEEERLNFYKKYVDAFPLGEFTYYDNVFDTALIFGIYPFRSLDDYFDYARGRRALELKKYFNTNYHYLVPSLGGRTKFNLTWNKPLGYFRTYASFKNYPLFLIGPYTFLKLSRTKKDFNKIFPALCAAYKNLFEELAAERIPSLHIEEPAFCGDLSLREVKLIVENYKKIIPAQLKINLITYYESVDFLDALYDLPLDSLGLDFVAGNKNLAILKKKGFPKDKKLICGIVDGRSVRRSDIPSKVKLLREIISTAKVKEEKIAVSNSAPLFHLPVTLESEKAINREAKAKISFAKERLYELSLIKKSFRGNCPEAEAWSRDVEKRAAVQRIKKLDTLSLREAEFLRRKKLQQKKLNLPVFPTTTIGSFPQDKELRRVRLAYRKGKVSADEYNRFIRERILALVNKQEVIGIDLLVHGEFERTDMVEFFAKKLKGFLTTDNGWVISYGTRAYRPPIIHGQIKRDGPITLKETVYAQSITPKPVKGIFTGPATIIAWSYNLRQEPLSKIAFELARALNKEAKDLADNGIKAIQIDEPAIKEFMPLKKEKRDSYFRWAIRAFNLTAQLPEEVQIHTHMCYSDFGEITKWIMKMNFDVITIESAREQAKIIDAFKQRKFNRAIGPGVWDIHSKYPAKEDVISKILAKSIKVFGGENVWVNPDCGLKTRGWPEVDVSLKRLVSVAARYRKKIKQNTRRPKRKFSSVR